MVTLRSLPRVVISAPASGQGKTTIAIGMMAALTRRGLSVAPAKVGPDYIDPGYHALATGRVGRNLDPVLLSADLVLPMLIRSFEYPCQADLAIIEGAMGLYDGQLGTDGFASTAHIAALTGSPVIVVADMSRAAGSLAAIITGLARFDAAISVAGVILNKSGSERHTAEVRRAVERAGFEVLGVLPRDAGVFAPSRHLGLVPVTERTDAARMLDRLAEQTAAHIDLDALVRVANAAGPITAAGWTPKTALDGFAVSGAPVIAVAGGRAFTFQYPETVELLQAAGCQPVTFDPARDRELPAGTAALYLGGGFPQVHAAPLGANTAMAQQIRSAMMAGMPCVAECAGMLYLCRDIDGRPMSGAIDASARMASRLTLGYRNARAAGDSVLAEAGTAVRGHEFHRTVCGPLPGPPAWQFEASSGRSAGASPSGPAAVDGVLLDPAGIGRATVHAAYLHLNWAGNPSLARTFAAAAAEFAVSGRRVEPSAPLAKNQVAEIARVALADEPVGLDFHGDREIDSRLADFAVNVRLPRPPAWLAADLVASMDQLGSYPSVEMARSALAAYHLVSPEMVLPTSGAAEAFTLLANAFDKKTLVIAPQFTEPESALLRAGRTVGHHFLDAERGFRLDAAAVTDDAELIIVGNPTNPTSVLHPRQQIAALACPGRILVVDEAFLDICPDEAAHTLIAPDMPGVLVIRSLTKTWGLAGLRAGYVVGDPKLIAALANRQPAWSVSSQAAVAMSAVCSTQGRAELARAVSELADHRSRLVSGLCKLGLNPVAGAAPFVLVRVPAGLRQALRQAGFAVRRCDSFPGLDASWIRIAVRPPVVCAPLIEAIGTILREMP